MVDFKSYSAQMLSAVKTYSGLGFNVQFRITKEPDDNLLFDF